MSVRSRLIAELQSRADSRGNVSGEAEDIRRSLAMNRHDLTKALFDLKALGKVDFREVTQGTQTYAADIKIRDLNGATPHRPAADREAEILEYLRLNGGGDGEWVDIAPKEMALTVGMTYNHLMHRLQAMVQSATLDAEYHGRGSRSGYKRVRVLPWAVERYRRESKQATGATETALPVTVATAPVSKAPTPLLDAYRAARDFAAQYPDSEYIRFEPIPIVEEALSLIES